MNKFLLLSFAAALGLAPICTHAQGPVNLKTSTVQGIGIPNNSTGYEFIVAVPPNEAENYEYGLVEAYVASDADTKIDIYNGNTKVSSYNVLGGKVLTVKLESRKAEIRTSQSVSTNTYRFVSRDNPISVYMLNAKSLTSDGFMALPVSAWGTKYFHNSYWENGEKTYNFFKSGFLVIGSEDSSNVTITLKSSQNSFIGKTDKGNLPGEILKIKLNKGEVYKVCTDAATIGEFDLSGTSVESDKPVGMISFHERATIPRFISSSRNHLAEMIPPVTAWGKSYSSVEFKREKGGGDLFRIMASEDSTSYTVNWYDAKTNKQIGSESGLLYKAGDFVELIDYPKGRPNISFSSIKGVSVFKADKPIQTYQYSFSAGWDGCEGYDPFYIVNTPIEQFSKETIIQAPSNKAFDLNYFNLLVIGDSSNTAKNDALLNSLFIFENTLSAGEQITLKYPELKNQRIPGTNIYWCTLTIKGGAYKIIGEPRFGGYVYGFSTVDGYGWPAASMEAYVGREDLLPPIVNVSGESGVFNVNLKDDREELVNGKKSYDFGINKKPELSSNSKNVKINFNNGAWAPNVISKNVNMQIEVIDKKQNADVEFTVTDRAGNKTISTFNYIAPEIKLEGAVLVDFGKVTEKSKVDKWFVFKNTGTTAITVSNIELLNKKEFEIVSGLPSNTIIQPNELIKLLIAYTPGSSIAKDMLKITASGVDFNYDVIALPMANGILVSDYNTGYVPINTYVFSGKSIVVENPGNDVLKITGFSLIDANGVFSINNNNYQFPITLNAKGTLVLNDIIKFAPIKPGEYSGQLIIHSDAASGDSIAYLNAKASKTSKVDEFDNNKLVSISPNPALNGIFTVVFEDKILDEYINVEITNEVGIKIKTLSIKLNNANTLTLNESDLNPGVYFFNFISENKVYSSKVSIVK